MDGRRSCSRSSRGSKRWRASGRKTARSFAGLAVETPKDLLLTLPQGGIDRSLKPTIRDVALPGTATVEVTVGRHRPPSGRGPYRVEVDDAATRFELVFFHARGDYLQRLLPTGARRIVSGRLELFDGVAQMAHPDHVLTPEGKPGRCQRSSPCTP